MSFFEVQSFVSILTLHLEEVGTAPVVGGQIIEFQVVHQFKITPEAFANFSPGFEHRENPGTQFGIDQTMKGFGGWRTLSRVQFYLMF